MVEIYNNAGTVSYGCFDHFKSARPTLDNLRETGKLGKNCPSVTVSNFHRGILQRVYRAEYRSKWNLILKWELPQERTVRNTVPQSRHGKAPRPQKQKVVSGIFASLQNTPFSSRQRYGIFSREF